MGEDQSRRRPSASQQRQTRNARGLAPAAGSLRTSWCSSERVAMTSACLKERQNQPSTRTAEIFCSSQRPSPRRISSSPDSLLPSYRRHLLCLLCSKRVNEAELDLRDLDLTSPPPIEALTAAPEGLAGPLHRWSFARVLGDRGKTARRDRTRRRIRSQAAQHGNRREGKASRDEIKQTFRA
eukprot:669891-Hanusia_phi.AAC.2